MPGLDGSEMLSPDGLLDVRAVPRGLHDRRTSRTAADLPPGCFLRHEQGLRKRIDKTLTPYPYHCGPTDPEP
jgi:hypothetical protein